MHALQQGDVPTVISLLAEDIVLVSDGGGKATAAVHPITSSAHVARFLLGLVRAAPQFEGGAHIELMGINGQQGCVIRSKEKGIVAVSLMHAENDVVQRLYFIRNPDKLQLQRLW